MRRAGSKLCRAALAVMAVVIVATGMVGIGVGVGDRPAAAADNPWPDTVIAGASTPTGDGYWLVRADGEVVARGDARHLGDVDHLALAGPLVGMASTPSGSGYWLVAADGGIFSQGDARFFGSMGGIRLDAEVFSMTPTRTGNGYWLVAYDGGIFTFGDAVFRGSMGGTALDAPITGITTSPSGRGYRMVATDGGIFSFGDTPFLGSLGGAGLRDVVGMAPTPSNQGYWILRADGEVSSFGDAIEVDSVQLPAGDRAAAIFANPQGQGFRVVTESGRTVGVGDAPGPDDPVQAQPIPTNAVYRVTITGEGLFTNGFGGFDRSGEPFAVQADLVIVPTLDPTAATGNGVNPVDVGIRTAPTPILGVAGALWFGTNTTISAVIGSSPPVGPSNIDVAVVAANPANGVVDIALDGNVFGLPTARIDYLNIFNLRTSIVAQIYNAFAGGMRLQLSPDRRTITGRIELGGSSGFAGPNVTAAYVATLSGVRIQ